MTTGPFDQERSEAFAGRMTEVLNDAALALMTSIGHRVGLFDAMADRPPATSQQIAEVARLNERYVREWLGAMVTGRIVDYNAENGTYSLAAEHAAWLTRAAGINNMALQAQYIPLLAQVEERMCDSFRQGGGVPYSAYPRFQTLMAEESGAVHDAALTQAILPLVPGLVERMQAGIDVADIGCGRGHAINLMAKAFPKSRFIGYDFSEEGIQAGRSEARAIGLSNARFETQDAAQLDMRERFDLITVFDAIHDQAQPDKVLRGVAQSLRPNGVFLMVDIAASSNVHENIGGAFAPFLYTISCLHCMTVSLALNGAGLGAMWGEQKARQMLHDAGFNRVDVQKIEGDVFNNYFIARKG